MLVSHRKKFIYTKTVKTGGTSVEAYFERFCMPEQEWALRHAREEYASDFGIVGFRGPKPPENCSYWNHMSAALIREKIGERVWSEYYKFCVVRNPYDKAVSAFYFAQHAKKGAVGFTNHEEERARFEAWVVDGSELPIDRDKFMINGKFCLDDVIRYEKLLAEMERICVRLGVPWEPSWLPSFKVGIRPKSAETAALYTPKSRKVVEAAFAFELDYFKYSFPQ